MTASHNKSNAQAHGYEFGGPIGAAAVSVGLPVVTYFILFACNDTAGCPAPVFLHPTSFTFAELINDIGWTGWNDFFNWKAFAATLGYYALAFVWYAVLPATEAEGTELRNGLRVKYRFNIWNTCMVNLGLLALGTAIYGADFVVWTFITNNYMAILTSSMIIAALLATYAYINSFTIRPGHPMSPAWRELALGGATGNVLYDWFIGRELNPPMWIPGIGHVDLKSYMEIRPAIMGWLIFDLAFIAKQYRNFGRVTDSILLVVFTQAVYILDSMWNEPAIMTQIDITTDGFGFMLAFGDLVWVPFTFTLQARYLAVYPHELGLLGVIGTVAVQLLGFYIFRAANSQKDVFRTRPGDPSVKNLSYIQTKTGSRLLTGGWWGMSRHINYLGDWILSWSYCLPTGLAGYVIQRPLSSDPQVTAMILKNGLEVVPGDARGWGMLITYFYLIYFAVLLIHRQRRDDAKCLRKYGKDWEEYVRQVPSRIIPGIY